MAAFQHSCCPLCLFLETITIFDDSVFVGIYDLYYCSQGGRFPTVIARYGNEGHEYTSGMPLNQEQADNSPDDPLSIAYVLAKERGYDVSVTLIKKIGNSGKVRFEKA